SGRGERRSVDKDRRGQKQYVNDKATSPKTTTPKGETENIRRTVRDDTTAKTERKNHPHLESPFQTKDKYARPLITPLRSFQGKLLLPAAAAQPPLRQTPKRDFSIAVANETLRLCRNGLLAACHLLPPPLSLSRCFPRPLLLNNTTKTSRHQ
ncbi:hypothetical protein RB213_008454, partial [Colletotrichum asianum]